jgi:hypothetical protein
MTILFAFPKEWVSLNSTTVLSAVLVQFSFRPLASRKRSICLR